MRKNGRGVRLRMHCKRCGERIPEQRRADSKFCSVKCQRNHRWEQITKLRTEMRTEYRLLTTSPHCHCGALLNNTAGKHGPVKRTCRKCTSKASTRRYTDRNRNEINQRRREKRRAENAISA